MALKAFISYSTTDKLIAAQVKTVLNSYRIESFMAHEDIRVTDDWKIRIIEELGMANVFIPLLSKAFKESNWAPQEIGIIFTRRDQVCIIPLQIDDTISFGFIANIQSERLPLGTVPENLIVDPLVRWFPRDLIPTMIQQLSRARDFRGAEALMLPMVPHFGRFNDEEIAEFARVSANEPQIWDAFLCRTDYLPKFIGMHRAKIPTETLKPLEYQVTSGHWFDPKRGMG